MRRVAQINGLGLLYTKQIDKIEERKRSQFNKHLSKQNLKMLANVFLCQAHLRYSFMREFVQTNINAETISYIVKIPLEN